MIQQYNQNRMGSELKRLERGKERVKRLSSIVMYGIYGIILLAFILVYVWMMGLLNE